MTILQGVRAFLDGSVVLGGGDGDREEGEEGASAKKDQSPVEVVYKKGVRVNGASEQDRDAALSEVSPLARQSGFSCRLTLQCFFFFSCACCLFCFIFENK